jgi:hypothetical protein
MRAGSKLPSAGDEQVPFHSHQADGSRFLWLHCSRHHVCIRLTKHAEVTRTLIEAWVVNARSHQYFERLAAGRGRYRAQALPVEPVAHLKGHCACTHVCTWLT